MTDKLIDNGEQTLLRFQCDCLDSAHALDVSIDKLTGDVMVNFANSYSAGPVSLWLRLKTAFAILRGRRVCLADFILRPEDRQRLIEALR